MHKATLGELMASRWETWELYQVNIVNNSFYFYFTEIDMDYLSIQLSKIIHELPLTFLTIVDNSSCPQYFLSQMFLSVALMNLILMVCCHL